MFFFRSLTVVLRSPGRSARRPCWSGPFPAHRFVALDAGQNAEAAETRPGEFLDTHRPPVILDEIQYAPRLLRDIKARVDRRREPGQYLLTGRRRSR